MLRIYNTLSRSLEEFIPRERGKVYMYNCGLTPYDYPHVGHARSAVIYDVIHRYLEYLGYEVIHISNFTDIDDKIIARSQELGITCEELTQKYIDVYLKDLKALNVKPLYGYPRATEHIKEIIEMVRTLQEKGFAYEISDGVYFEVRKFKDYGKLSHRNLEELRSGARIEVNPEKKDPLDFAIWKKSREGEPSWDSPWGKGRPGWHIECSAMSLHYLGNSFDIHGGGDDLIFPHHENEIAQSEAYTGISPFARYWVHNGMVEIEKEKMSKSLKNFFNLDELLRDYDGEVVRLYLISVSYRKPLSFDIESLEVARKNYEYFNESFLSINEDIERNNKGDVPVEDKILQWRSDFRKAMDDDLNFPVAIALLFDIFKFFNGNKEKISSKEALKLKEFLNEMLGVLGIEHLGERRASVLSSLKDRIMDVIGFLSKNEALRKELSSIDKEMAVNDILQSLVDLRAEMRLRQDFVSADQIRDALKEVGVVLEDTKEGTKYRLVST